MIIYTPLKRGEYFMLKYESITEKLSNNNKISQETVNLLGKYIFSLYELNIITKEEDLIKLIDKTVTSFDGVVYYDNNDKNLLESLGIGKNNKGLSVGNKIYVNNNMTEELKNVTLFHEFTHFLQRYHLNGYEDCVGVMRDFKWRLLMEGQTQNIAEMVYEHINNVTKEERVFKSEELRMKSGGVIVSNLRNYEMYDFILKKILLALGITIEDFIYINFCDKASMPIFEKLLDDRLGKQNREELFRMLDIIYSSDVIKYSYGLDSLKEPYIVPSIVDEKSINVSDYSQFDTMKKLDNFLIEVTKNNPEIHSRLLNMQFARDRLLESNIEEQYYTTHFENGVETVKKSRLL